MDAKERTELGWRLVDDIVTRLGTAVANKVPSNDWCYAVDDVSADEDRLAFEVTIYNLETDKLAYRDSFTVRYDYVDARAETEEEIVDLVDVRAEDIIGDVVFELKAYFREHDGF